jgi:hypothetical protein
MATDKRLAAKMTTASTMRFSDRNIEGNKKEAHTLGNNEGIVNKY